MGVVGAPRVCLLVQYKPGGVVLEFGEAPRGPRFTAAPDIHPAPAGRGGADQRSGEWPWRVPSSSFAHLNNTTAEWRAAKYR